MRKIEKEQVKKIFFEYYPFIFIFIFVFIFLLNRGTMCDVSGDAADMWETIKTYGMKDMYASYVLYKGFQAVYPYVWLYKMAVFFGVNEWLLVMMFYSLAFSYITTIGFPHLVELFCQIRPVHYRKLILAIVCFYLWVGTGALSQFMIDLPSLMYFLLLTNSALRLYRYGVQWKYLLWCAIWLGMNLGGSGQYTASAFCIIIFLGIVLRKDYCEKKDKKIAGLLENIGLLVFPAGLIKIYNDYFLNVIVGGLRQIGAWIPSNDVWLKIGLSRFMDKYRGGIGASIPSNLNQAIFQAYLGNEIFEQNQSTILAGGYGMSVIEYMGLVLKYPINFALCYLEKLFLILSPDGGAFRFLPLFIFYTLMFIAFKIGISKNKSIKSVFNAKLWIVFAFLWSIVPALVMVLESRYAMQLQGFILAIALCKDELWKKLFNVLYEVRNWKLENVKKIGEGEIPYTLIFYCCFIIACFLHMSSLYELIGVDAEKIMLTFW